MTNSKALITLAIGEHYRTRWQILCAKNWHQYAEKNGYDVICFDQPLDQSSLTQSRPPAWQKCLILGQEQVQKYEQVVWVDSDILINPNAPCIASTVPPDKIGAVEMFVRLGESLPPPDCSLAGRHSQLWQWPVHTAHDYYNYTGVPVTFDKVVQTGVMVLSPNIHRSILEDTYYNYEQTPKGNFEMESLSYEILKAGCVQWIDKRFNTLWVECMLRDYPFLLSTANVDHKLVRFIKRLTRGHYQLPPRKITAACLTATYINNYFLHFAGVVQYMHWVDTQVVSWQALRGIV